MTVNELVVILQNRLITLAEARKSAVASGDVERVLQVDNDLLSTTMTIEQLNLAK